jgi:dihydrofolate reductase
MIIGIVAIAENSAIGKDGKLPWHYSSDLKFFKQTTSGNAIVAGRKTFDSIGKALPNRLNIVLSRSLQIEAKSNVFFAQSKDEVLALSKYLNCDIFIIGGETIYREFADMIEKWIVTEIPQTIENADAFMPANFLDNFKVVENTQLDGGLSVKIYRLEFANETRN